MVDKRQGLPAYRGIDRFYSYRSQGLHNVEPWQAMSGPSAPGGGSSGKQKKSKKGNKPTVYVWGENL